MSSYHDLAPHRQQLLKELYESLQTGKVEEKLSITYGDDKIVAIFGLEAPVWLKEDGTGYKVTETDILVFTREGFLDQLPSPQRFQDDFLLNTTKIQHAVESLSVRDNQASNSEETDPAFPTVFICYSHQDMSFVNQVTADLNRQGIATWRDKDNIPGHIASNTVGWRQAIQSEGLPNATHMVVILSPDAVESAEVQSEWNWFIRQKKPVYPVLYRDCEIPYRLESLQIYDLSDNYWDGFSMLVRALTGEPIKYAHSSNRKHYIMISIDDISNQQAKRYRAKLLVSNYDDEYVLRTAIYQANEHLKDVVEHRSSQFKKLWGDTSPHFIHLLVYGDLTDQMPIAESYWRDPSSESAKNIHIPECDDSVEDIEIRFAHIPRDVWKEHVESQVMSKTDFIKEVRRWDSFVNELLRKTRTLDDQFAASKIELLAFDKGMAGLTKEYQEIVKDVNDDLTTGLFECKDTEDSFFVTNGSLTNVFLVYTQLGLSTWVDAQSRYKVFKGYWGDFLEDYEKLSFEMNKLTGTGLQISGLNHD